MIEDAFRRQLPKSSRGPGGKPRRPQKRGEDPLVNDPSRGFVRGLTSRNAKTLPVDEFPLGDWLEEHVSKERRAADPDGPLFVNPDGRSDGWWSEAALRRTWGKACEAAGVSRAQSVRARRSTAARTSSTIAPAAISFPRSTMW